jgi:hypothetical protein
MIHDYHCIYCDHCGALKEDGIHECLVDMLTEIKQLENRLAGKRTIYRFATECGKIDRCRELEEEAAELKQEIAAAKQKYKMKQRKSLYGYDPQDEQDNNSEPEN